MKGMATAVGASAPLASNRLRTGDPQDGEMASKLLEIAVGRDERGLIQGS
jgi:hypothetical protein